MKKLYPNLNSEDKQNPRARQNPVDSANRSDCHKIFGSIIRQKFSPSVSNSLRKRFTKILPHLPDPIQSLNTFALVLRSDDHGTINEALLSKPVLTQILTLFSYSNSLGRGLIRRPQLIATIFPLTRETPEQMWQRLSANKTNIAVVQQASWLRDIKLEEYIRIAVSDFFRYDTFDEITRKISLVADYCVISAVEFSGLSTWPIAILAMGKWGGLELNYSSDIDLLFVAANQLSLEDLATVQTLAGRAIRLLEQVTADGFVFRVDNRLRPEGKTGSLVKTIQQYLEHYNKYALGWEFQALVKARPAAGLRSVGDDFIRATRPLVYNPTLSPEIILQQVREMKRKIEKALVTHHHQNANVKLGVGGIRDIEFIVQFLQLHHGRFNANLHQQNTITAIKRLYTHRIIPASERDILHKEYVFLRRLEHYLQITDELPLRQLPTDSSSLDILGMKIGFHTTTRDSAGDQLLRRYQEAINRTRTLFRNFFDATIEFLEKKQTVRNLLAPDIDNIIIDNHFTRLESDYYFQFSDADIARHIRLIDRLSNERLCEVEVTTLTENSWRVTIVAHDYLGAFAKICGLFSAYGLSIFNGESFTYAEQNTDNSPISTKDAFYRRRNRKYHSRSAYSAAAKPDDRKIVCVATLRMGTQTSATPLNSTEFRDELEALLRLLRDRRFDEANQRITLRVIDANKDQLNISPQSRVLPPIEFKIDNDSDHVYTILEIESDDKFMFLFEFSNALATRNYYIGKVEINTLGDLVRDRLFITTKQGKKVVSEKRIHNLKMTITLIKQFATFLPFAPNPSLALKQFGDFVDCVFDAQQKGEVPIIDQKDHMEDLARILGASSFLWEDFLRMQYQNLLPILIDVKKLGRSATIAALRGRLRRHLAHYDGYQDRVDCLNRFKDREMFRTDLRHLTRRVPRFTGFCSELSSLADVVISEAYSMAVQYVREKRKLNDIGTSCLCALGKWGGREIGYASDIELLLLWDAEDRDHIELVEFFENVAQAIEDIIKSRRDGIFELDFRLRPGGKSAHLATPYNRFLDYFSPVGDADPYERQALIRLRTIAGDRKLQKKVRDHRNAYVYGSHPFDSKRIRYLRERQASELVTSGQINAKFSPGGLVDAEYFIQILQIIHGHKHHSIRSTNTLDAAKALVEQHCLAPNNYQIFEQGYRFLRALINGLRIVRGNALDLVIPPQNSQEFQYLLRRLESFEHPPGTADAWQYITDQMSTIHDLFNTLW